MQLNVEQKKIIQAEPKGHVLVKGVAGSGKTTVAVNRIPFLLNHYCFEKDDNILMVTYNKLLVNYIKHISSQIDQEEQQNISFFKKDYNKHVSISTVDSLIYRYFIQYKRETGEKLDLLPYGQQGVILNRAIAETSRKHRDIKLINPRYYKFLLDEIDWIKSCNYMERTEYQNADRIGRTSTSDDGPQRIMKNSATREAIYDLMLRYNELLAQKQYVDFKDMALITYDYIKNNNRQKYTHIILDESQDLTRMQIEFIKLLYKDKEYSNFMFVCDTAQSIYPHSWLVKGRSFASVGFDMTGKSNSLTKNYRTTTQIAEAAYSLIEKDDNIIENENYVEPSLVDRQGSYPVCKYFNNEQDEMEYISREIKSYLLGKYQKKDVAIIARTGNKLKSVQGYLDRAGIKNEIISGKNSEFNKDTVKLLTMHSIKGLEFKVVIIVGLDNDAIPLLSYQDLNDESLQESMDRKLLYVGMTRANDLLYLTTSSESSKFLNDINHKYLKFDRLSRFKHYFPVKCEDYLFKDKISDLYSNEEKIRQWVLRELIDTYKYPKRLISIEHQVSQFSKVGYVDICISTYKDGRLVPYIFIETKAYGEDIRHGITQVESYMASSLSCQYALVINGNKLKIFNRKLEEQGDIPSFNPSMLPSSIEEYNYIDFNNNSQKTISRDTSDSSYIIVKEGNNSRNYENKDLESIPIFDKIAAGNPVDVNEELVDNFKLPSSWMKNKSYYMLSVRGDSMIGANINDGDYVLIKQEETAQNRDIVVAMIGDDATLKRFIKMGDSILLMPENSDYEPIQLTGEQFKILGVVRGVLKMGSDPQQF